MDWLIRQGDILDEPAVVTDPVRRARRAAAEAGGESVALTALAIGYGKLTPRQFAAGLLPLAADRFGTVERVTVVARRPQDVDDVTAVAPFVRVDRGGR